MSDSAGLRGARAYASERLASVSSVRIGGSKKEVIAMRVWVVRADDENVAGEVSSNKTLGVYTSREAALKRASQETVWRTTIAEFELDGNNGEV